MHLLGLWFVIPLLGVLTVAMIGIVVWPIAVLIALFVIVVAIVVFASGPESARREPTGQERPGHGDAKTANERIDER